MQADEEGLKANLLSAPDLKSIILDYFRTDWLHVPAEWEPAANELLQILHERNWMVCPRGPDHYGFVHRQFMEHLVASALLARHLADESSFADFLAANIVPHAADDTWREILPIFVAMLVAVSQRKSEMAIEAFLPPNEEMPGGADRLLLALRCYGELEPGQRASLQSTGLKLMDVVYAWFRSLRRPFEHEELSAEYSQHKILEAVRRMDQETSFVAPYVAEHGLPDAPARPIWYRHTQGMTDLLRRLDGDPAASLSCLRKTRGDLRPQCLEDLWIAWDVDRFLNSMLTLIDQLDGTARLMFFDTCWYLFFQQLFDKYPLEEHESPWLAAKSAKMRDYCLQISSTDPSPKARAAALKAAIKLARDDDAPLRLMALERWRSEPDPAVRAAYLSMSRLRNRDQEADAQIVAQLRASTIEDPTPAARLAALFSLCQYIGDQHEVWVPLLRERGILDPAPSVRAAVLEHIVACQRREDDSWLPVWLYERAMTDDSAEVRARVLGALTASRFGYDLGVIGALSDTYHNGLFPWRAEPRYGAATVLADRLRSLRSSAGGGCARPGKADR
jgi:hypothetical protein